MQRHGSVRHYTDEPVPDELIETIVAAAQRASTSSNLQMYSVVVTREAEARRHLYALCGEQKHILQAPVFLTWCADFSRLERVCQMQGYTLQAGYMENLLLATVDTALAMQNAALAAESLGLGMCYIGAIRNNPRQVIRLLGLPRLVFPLCGMTLGWPARPPRVRPRLPLEAVLHWERYNPDDEAALRAYDQTMAATGIYKGRQEGGKSIPEQTYGWLEHSARRVSRPLRVHLRQALAEAGFEAR